MRLGPETRALVDELNANACVAHATFLSARRGAGDWTGSFSPEVGARYLVDQIGLAITQRASGEDSAEVRESLTLALSVFGG